MALSYGPSIVTNGLVLCLDAGDGLSYPSNGVTWTDLSGQGNHGTLSNVSYSNSNNGSLSFNGTNSGVQLSHNSTWVLTPSNSFSLCSWFYAEPTTQFNSMIFSHQKCNSPAFQIVVNDITSLAFRVSGNFNQFATYSSNVTGQWNYVVATFGGSSGEMKLYLNGNLRASNVNNKGWSSYTPGYSEVWLGRRYPCSVTNELTGKISTFSFYKDKVLTSSEILQNFNALRGRFGV